MEESYGLSRIGKPPKQTRATSTMRKNLTEEIVQKSIAKDTAQAVKTKTGNVHLDDGSICICGKERDAIAIRCDNKDCEHPGGWYHLECVGLTEAPKGKWLCPTCTKNLKTTDPKKATKSTNDSLHKLPKDGDAQSKSSTTPRCQKLPPSEVRTAPAGGSRSGGQIRSRSRPRPVTTHSLPIRSRTSTPSTGGPVSGLEWY